MKTFILMTLPLIISMNSSEKDHQAEGINKRIKIRVEKKSADELIDRIERLEIVKNFENMMKRRNKNFSSDKDLSMENHFTVNYLGNILPKMSQVKEAN